jgi:hypothetical protein
MVDRSDLIIQYFGYLINEFGFRVEQKVFDPQTMGNAFVVFESSEIGIEIVIDRNQVLIKLGDKMEPREKWFEFSDVLKYFSPSEEAYIFYEKTEDHTWDEAIEAQLKRLAIIVLQYCEPILRGRLEMKKELKAIEEKRVAKMLKRFKHHSIY